MASVIRLAENSRLLNAISLNCSFLTPGPKIVCKVCLRHICNLLAHLIFLLNIETTFLCVKLSVKYMWGNEIQVMKSLPTHFWGLSNTKFWSSSKVSGHLKIAQSDNWRCLKRLDHLEIGSCSIATHTTSDYENCHQRSQPLQGRWRQHSSRFKAPRDSSYVSGAWVETQYYIENIPLQSFWSPGQESVHTPTLINYACQYLDNRWARLSGRSGFCKHTLKLVSPATTSAGKCISLIVVLKGPLQRHIFNKSTSSCRSSASLWDWICTTHQIWHQTRKAWLPVYVFGISWAGCRSIPTLKMPVLVV